MKIQKSQVKDWHDGMMETGNIQEESTRAFLVTTGVWEIVYFYRFRS